MKALILNGRVADLHETGFEVHSSMSWVDCDDKVDVGWTYDGKTFKTNIIEPIVDYMVHGYSSSGVGYFYVTALGQSGKAYVTGYSTYGTQNNPNNQNNYTFQPIRY